jgi:hypothetical protein
MMKYCICSCSVFSRNTSIISTPRLCGNDVNAAKVAVVFRTECYLHLLYTFITCCFRDNTIRATYNRNWIRSTRKAAFIGKYVR